MSVVSIIYFLPDASDNPMSERGLWDIILHTAIERYTYDYSMMDGSEIQVQLLINRRLL